MEAVSPSKKLVENESNNVFTGAKNKVIEGPHINSTKSVYLAKDLHVSIWPYSIFMR